jgi:hypothetical protein
MQVAGESRASDAKVNGISRTGLTSVKSQVRRDRDREHEPDGAEADDGGAAQGGEDRGYVRVRTTPRAVPSPRTVA